LHERYHSQYGHPLAESGYDTVRMPDEEPRLEQPQTPEPRPAKDQEPMLFCPVCDQKLSARQCKLVCERCGYFMSCADYY
jgi:hypothetical protein